MHGNLAAQEVNHNRLTPEEKELGFELVFNGWNFEGWKNPGGWVIEAGTFAFRERGGGLIYRVKRIPDNFELRFQRKVAEGGNNGVTCRPGLYEYQILDNAVHADGKNPRTSAASLYFCIQPSRDATKPVGEWNCGRVVCKGTVVQHWLNGEKVIDLDYADPKFADPQNLDFHLAADSPALKLGFKPFDYSKAGVYGDTKWIEKAKEATFPPLEIAPDPPPLALPHLIRLPRRPPFHGPCFSSVRPGRSVPRTRWPIPRRWPRSAG